MGRRKTARDNRGRINAQGLGGPATGIPSAGAHAWLQDTAVTHAWIADAAYTGGGATLTTWLPAKGAISQAGVGSPTLSTTWGATNLGLITFDGIAQYTTFDALAALVTGDDKPWSVCIAFKHVVAATAKVIFGFSDTSDTLRFHLLQTTTSGGTKWGMFRNATATVSAIVTSPVPDTANHVCTIIFDGVAVTVRFDGIVTNINGTAQDVASFVMSKATLGVFRGATVAAFANISVRAVAFGTSAWGSGTYGPIETDFIAEAA